MITPADRERIDRFVAKIRDAGSDGPRMDTAVLAELSDIHQRINPETGELYAMTTTRSLITGYRSVLKAELGEDAPVLEKFRHSAAHVAQYRRHQREQREERHRNQRPLNGQEHIERAVALVNYNAKVRWSNAAAIAGVVALTGRRPYEVGCVGGFEPDSADVVQVMFSEQTKTRETERAGSPYSIPVLAERDLVLETVARIREEVDPALDNKTYSQRFGKEVGLVSKRTFTDAERQPITPRELRQAYAAVAYRKFARSNISAVQFYNDILGHQSDMNATLFYFDFYLSDSITSQ
ncbi:protelomerase family protein [Streptomyces filamentosus]|uniref:protelomerase family protein n=1 Tax=Streptomyces filamentosus TaxID=67294 RepID=UPI0033C674C0